MVKGPESLDFFFTLSLLGHKNGRYYSFKHHMWVQDRKKVEGEKKKRGTTPYICQ